ncbi:MAG: glycosyltransferase family 2 protein [Candidatus Dojkabacteria bacterium]
MMKLLIYMPALNEEEGIGEVIGHLPKHIDGIDEIDILVVDDGSTDKTAKIAKEHGAKVVSHGINRGVGRAFQSAVQYALENKTDILVSIDADRQFNSDQIPEMIQPLLNDKADMITGNRFGNGMPENMPKSKYWGNKQMSRLISLISGQKFRDVSCGFRAYNREALLNLNLFGEFTYTQESIMDMVYKGLRVIEFPVEVTYYKQRKSRVANNVFKYAFKTIKIILDTLRDYKPMLFFGGMGGICFLVSILIEGFVFTHYFTTGEFTPYKVLGFFGLGLFIFGLFLQVIGLLANMLNRIRKNQENILYEIKRQKK